MLIEKNKVSANDIVAIKLINGDEITGKLLEVDEQNKSYTIFRPVILRLVNIGHGEGGISFAPFMLGLEDHGKVTINEEKMLTRPIKARPDLAREYTKATTGLEVPKNSLVI